jgi:hypothetical protein
MAAIGYVAAFQSSEYAYMYAYLELVAEVSLGLVVGNL